MTAVIPFDVTSRMLERLISPPQDRRNIITIAPVIANVLGVMREMALSYSRCEEVFAHLDEMIELCHAIELGADSVPSEWIPKMAFSRGSYITEHPVYAALDHLSQRSTRSLPRVVLLAHVILSVYAGRSRGTGSGTVIPIPDINVLAACREIRLLSDDYLEQFGEVNCNPLALYQSLEAFIRSNPAGIASSVLARFRNLRRIIGLSLGRELPQSRTRGSNGPREYVDTSWRDDLSGVDPDDGLATDGLLAIPALSSDDEQALHEGVLGGLSASDTISANSIQMLNARYSGRQGKAPEHGLYQQRAVANQIKRSAQLLAGRWEQLNELDWVSFLEWVERDISPESLALLLSAVTGRPLKQVADTKLYGSSDLVPLSHSDEHISLCAESRTWISKPLRPERRRPMRAAWDRNLASASETLALPIPDFLWAILIRFLGEPSKWGIRNLFSRAQKFTLLHQAKEALREGVRREDTGLTVTRLQRQLFNRLVSGNGDIADAVLITGIMPPYGQSTALYYYHTTVERLQNLYLDTIAQMPGLQNECSTFMRQLVMNEESIGSPFYPKPERLPLLVSDLKAAVAQARTMPTADHALAEFHNHYTVYTAFLVAFATGYRSVRFPISRESDIDEASGFLVVADKLGDDMSHSRLVPIAPILRDHLRLYRTYREALIHRLWALHKQAAPEHFLFFLEKRSTGVSSITPKKLMEHSEWAYDLPLNTNRHFLRSELRARGVAGEMVDVFMGHWSQGQEPHGKFSSFDYRDYRDQLAPALNRILIDMGWEPLEGWL